MSSRNRVQSGFTLIEAVMVIVITGVLGAVVTSFVRPLQGYFDTLSRADLSDVADTALRRMGRDVRLALPNSVRISGSYLEFLPITTGGRYRANPTGGTAGCGAAGDELSFSVADTCFEVIGILPTPPGAPVAGDELVVYNTTPAAVYAGDNVAAIAAGSTTGKIMFAANLFPFDSPGKRFQIIGRPVTYACSGTTLWRYTGYARRAAQPITIATLDGLTGVTKARIATGVNCAASVFSYNPGSTQRTGLVTMSLTLSNNTDARDSVTLLHQVHVQNVP